MTAIREQVQALVAAALDGLTIGDAPRVILPLIMTCGNDFGE